MPTILKAFFIGRYAGFIGMLIVAVTDFGLIGSLTICIIMCFLGVGLTLWLLNR